jgi:hypothetical protein
VVRLVEIALDIVTALLTIGVAGLIELFSIVGHVVLTARTDDIASATHA